MEGRRALVIGGSRGIGAAIVRRLARDGADVCFTYVQGASPAETVARETGAHALHSDAGDRAATIATVRDAGPLDILIVNAGIRVAGDPTTLSPDVIDRLFDVNIRAPYHAAVEAARTMTDGGRIVLIGSIIADRVPGAGIAAYAASKSALRGLTRGLARDLGPRGITVNVIEPGPVDTDLNPADGPSGEANRMPLAIRRHIKADEVASLVAYLVGPDAAMITGAAYRIDGGFAC